MFRSFHLLPNVMHTHETLVLHRSISITPAIKKEKKKPSYNSSINKPRRRTRFRFETKVPIVSTLRAETWRSLSLLPLPRNHETVHDPMTPPRATILRFLDFHFALLYLRSQTVTRLFENSARSKRFFFFIRPSFRRRGFVEVVISRVSFYFSANVVEKRKGSVPSRARVDRSLIERSSDRRLNPRSSNARVECRRDCKQGGGREKREQLCHVWKIDLKDDESRDW